VRKRITSTVTILAALSMMAGNARAEASPGSPLTVGAQAVLTGLAFPAAFTFFPDGRILFGERFTGKIKIYDPATHQTTTFFTVPNISTTNNHGLLGLAVHPGYPSAPYVYAFASRNIGGVITNQFLRITDSGGTGSDMQTLVSIQSVPDDPHDGGRILFGPDGMVYAVVGDGGNEANAQNLNSNRGKVLRMTDTGGVPPDNPFPNKRIFTYGLRNSFGFAFDPQTGLLWETENGPACNDEINIERPGENHAWGTHETCVGQPPQNTNQDGPLPRVLPLKWFTPTIAPTGVAFCSTCGLPGGNGKMYFGTYNTSNIRRVALTADRQGIASMATVYTHSEGVLSLERGPDNALYFSDSKAIYRLIAV